MEWLKQAAKYVFDKTGLRGIAIVTGLLLAVFVAVVAALTLTPLGGWVAELLGV